MKEVQPIAIFTTPVCTVYYYLLFYILSIAATFRSCSSFFILSVSIIIVKHNQNKITLLSCNQLIFIRSQPYIFNVILFSVLL